MMAGLLSLVQELLPMIMPGSVEITRAADIRPGSPLFYEDEDETPKATAGEETGEKADPEGGEDMPTRSRSEDRTAQDRSGVQGEITGPAEDTRRDISRNIRDSPERPRNKAIEEGNGNDDLNGLIGPDGLNGLRIHSSSPQRMPETAPNVAPPTTTPRRRRTGVSMRDAMVHKTDRMCAVVLTVKPLCSTVIFHNAEQECIVYAVTGTAVLATLSEEHDAHDDSDSTVPPPPPARHVLGPGDFAFIPAWTEHQVSNESPDTDVVWVAVRTGPEPTVVPLSEWGGPEASS